MLGGGSGSRRLSVSVEVDGATLGLMLGRMVVVILQAHALSKGFFQAGMWPTLSPKALRRIHGCIMHACVLCYFWRLL